MMTGFGMGLGLLGIFIIIAFFGGLIALVVWAVRAAGKSERSSPGTPTALEVLDTRYARGEINQEQYEQTKGDLSHSI